MDFVKPDVQQAYLRHNEVNQYLDYLERRYPKLVKVHTIGKSYEGRAVKAIEIDLRSNSNLNSTVNSEGIRKRSVNTENSCNSERNLIFIEAGTHAREWMTIAVALQCIQQLTEKHMRHMEMLQKLRFYIVPIVNPDGYEYTYEKNPLWRKNRRPISNTKSIGTDCNRNYDIYWERGPSKGSRCTFKGEAPFSEPETCAVRNALLKLQPNLLFFLSLHSYAQSIMYPWGYTKDLPAAWKKLKQLAECGRNAIKQLTGRTYRCGSISGIRKRTYSGTIVDYAYSVVEVPLALVMELPSPKFGFQPNKEHIRPIGNESWIGIKAMCKQAYELGRNIPARKNNILDIMQPRIKKKKIVKLITSVSKLGEKEIKGEIKC